MNNTNSSGRGFASNNLLANALNAVQSSVAPPAFGSTSSTPFGANDTSRISVTDRLGPSTSRNGSGVNSSSNDGYGGRGGPGRTSNSGRSDGWSTGGDSPRRGPNGGGFGRGGRTSGGYRGGRGGRDTPPLRSSSTAASSGSGRPYVTFAEDRDGDQAMGSDQPEPGRSRSAPYSRRGGRSDGPSLSRTGAPLRSSVSIDGVASNVAIEDVATFLTKKADRTARVVRGQWANGKIVLLLETPEQATTIKRLDGISFAGANLTIRYDSSSVSQPRPSSSARSATRPGASPSLARSQGSAVIEQLTLLVRSRYSQEAKRLDFDRVHDDPIVMTERLKVFDHHDPSSKLGPVLCKIIGEQCPGLETLSLSGNRLRTLAHFSSLHQRLPSLVNLSLQDNQLVSFRDLEPFSGKEFKNLRELLLIGNPVRERELIKAGGNINYTSDVKKLFPTIQLLDMEPVLEEIQFGVQATARFPLDVKPGFIDSDATRAIADQFVQAFFTLFDTNRAGLIDFYADEATFSLSVNSIRVSNGSGAFYANSGRSDRSFDSWWSFNRNLSKLKVPDKRVSMAFQGGPEIVRVFGKIPSTEHPLKDPPEKRRFLIEAFQRGAAPSAFLFISAHGEFKEVEVSCRRSFDRTFVIIPAPPGSRSAMANLPFTIINDAWVVRHYTNNYAWYHTGDAPPNATSESVHIPAAALPPPAGQQPPAVQVSPWPQLPDPATLQQLKAQHNLSDQQHHLVVEFSKATGLNFQFSLQCLQETAWIQDRAMQAFVNAKPSIPPQAYRL
ncbi:hypothetical protein BC831DRAFT_481597 [Entophlyctis helioformis]|nr:hypothetical protein BC831DRAFT_481597 [Entophlyctis helioformis]